MPFADRDELLAAVAVRARRASMLGDALEAAAHGHAMLLLDGSYGEGPEAIDRAAAQAAGVTLALIQARSALGRSTG